MRARRIGIRAMATAGLVSLLLCVVLVGFAQVRQANPKENHEQHDFSIEQEIVPIERPVGLPESALQALQEDSAVISCLADQNVKNDRVPSSWFVASEVHLAGPDEIDLIVLPAPLKASGPMHPAPNACFMGPYTGKFWVLRQAQKGYEIVLRDDAHDLGVRRTKWKGYRDIDTSLRTLNGTTIRLFRFDGKQYKLHSEKSEARR